MKLALNGALTIGTLDGANIEIMEEIGRDNIFIFGMDVHEVEDLRKRGYNPREYYERLPALRKVLDQIAGGVFSPENRDLFKPIVDALLNEGDRYLVLADYASYIACQEEVGKLFRNRDEWARRSILNTAAMGTFSSDRTVAEYALDIWGVKTLAVNDAIKALCSKFKVLNLEP
jgi:starch phosphorylase